MKSKIAIEPVSRSEWQDEATARLKLISRIAQSFSGLKKVGPKIPSGQSWTAEIQLVGRTVMSRLNFTYRKKNYPTDVLSFSAPSLFAKQGVLGELVICLPVLKAQAKRIGISASMELDVLLVHGILHLLGFDHEKGPKEAALMACWERKMLDQIYSKTKKFQRGLSLIERSNSGKESS